MHNDKVITYESRKLKVHDKNYPTQYIELAAVNFALKIWHHYLYGVNFDVLNDKRDYNMCSLRESLISYKGGGQNCLTIMKAVFFTT